MTITATSAGPAGALRRRLRGAVVGPDDTGWDDARRAYNLVVDQRPAAIATPVDETDVAAVVAFAREHGLRVAPQRTGHNAAPLGALDETVLVRTDALQGVRIDAARRVARVRAGAKWQDVVPQASDLGLAALHGSTGDVSVVGYSLGGGLGWYARSRGLAANSIRAVELVTADGRLVRADADNEAELFWALRGGGGGFGVVTALEFELFAQPEVHAGVLFFPWERSGEVLHAWHEWLPSVPEEVTSVGRILQLPPLPEIPEPLRGNAFVLVEAVSTGSAAELDELLRPLRALGPSMDTFATQPPAGIAELHMDPPHPVPYVSDHQLLGPLGPQTLDAFVAVTGPDSGSPLVSVELRHLGGALARAGEGHGALATLPGAFAFFGVGMAVEPGLTAASEAQLGVVTEALAPVDVGRYGNFTEAQVSASRLYPAAVCERLRAVKRAWDPDGTIQASHELEEARR
jgi:hypothetical protein